MYEFSNYTQRVLQSRSTWYSHPFIQTAPDSWVSCEMVLLLLVNSYENMTKAIVKRFLYYKLQLSGNLQIKPSLQMFKRLYADIS
jgi:hypothetical protein